MERMTKATDCRDIYIVDESNVKLAGTEYSGEAINKLAKFENVYDDLISKQSELSKELDKLRAEGKTNTVKFKQLLVNKMNNNNVLVLFKGFGLE